MSEPAASITDGQANGRHWIALLGRRDVPTDGVDDYCAFLGRALAQQGIELERVRVSWDENGWNGSLRELHRKSKAWRRRWVLLQYTAMGWSRRGSPLVALAATRIARRSGAKLAVVFHEPSRQPGLRWINRLRGACQDRVIHELYRQAERAIFTVPLDTVNWLPREESKAAFIPIGANIPERLNRPETTTQAPPTKTVIVFGVTEAPVKDREVEEIAEVIKETSKAIAKMRLVVVGRGAAEAQKDLARALNVANVELVVQGVLPAEEIAHEFERADALLFVRGAVTLQRGSALAAIACGVPIVGYRNGDLGEPLREAGVEWSPWQDRSALVRGLIRVLSDPSHWRKLHERNLEAQKNHFAWNRIAERYQMVLAE